jgi:hypothetical protein
VAELEHAPECGAARIAPPGTPVALVDRTLHGEMQMASSDRGVPRGDHVESEEQQQSIREQDANKRGVGVQADAAARVDATQDQASPTPPLSKGSDRGGDSGWGGEPAGGSVIDKRGPKK